MSRQSPALASCAFQKAAFSTSDVDRRPPRLWLPSAAAGAPSLITSKIQRPNLIQTLSRSDEADEEDEDFEEDFDDDEEEDGWKKRRIEGTLNPAWDRTRIIPVELSIKYMESAAYQQVYGDNKVRIFMNGKKHSIFC